MPLAPPHTVFNISQSSLLLKMIVRTMRTVVIDDDDANAAGDSLEPV